MNQNVERNFTSYQNGTDKTNSKSESPTKIKVSFDFYRVSDVPDIRVRLCTCFPEMTLGCAYWSRCAKYNEYGMSNISGF